MIKKILSERNLVIMLFITALVVFSFAKEDARKASRYHERQVQGPAAVQPDPQTGLLIPVEKASITARDIE